MSGEAQEVQIDYRLGDGEEEEEEEEECDEDDGEDTEEEDDVAAKEPGPSNRDSSLPSPHHPPPSPSRIGASSTRPTKQHREYALVELTSLDDLLLPSNATRSVKYTCISCSRRLLVLGTSTGSVYVFARFASKHRSVPTNRLGVSGTGPGSGTVPLHVYTTKDGPLHTVRISPNEQMICVGSESGRVSVLSLSIGVASSSPTVSSSTSSPTPNSPLSALIHTVPGDARKSDRVNCLCWSSDSTVVYAAHQSGIVAVHKIGTRRSVFRSAVDRLLQLNGPCIQMEYSSSPATNEPRLLISTNEATFIHDLSAAKVYQVGSKPRNAPMGGCWMKGETTEDEFVLSARQNGRIWEASLTGIVYKTHQLRQSDDIPTLDTLSFRTPPSPSLLPQTTIDNERRRSTVHLGTLHTMSADVGVDESSSTTTPVTPQSTTSSTVSTLSSTSTVPPPAAARFVLSHVHSTLLVADIDRSSLIVVSDLEHVIRDVSVCGSDVFVLFTGGIGVRKYTLFPIERAIDRLLLKKAPHAAARLVLSVDPPQRDGDGQGQSIDWPMPIIEKISAALATLKKKESECLRHQLSDLMCGRGLGDRRRRKSIDEDDDDGDRRRDMDDKRSTVVAPHRVLSDRYLEKRGFDEEERNEKEKELSDYEDGEGRIFGRRERRDTLREKSRSTPDTSRSAVSSPRKEKEKEGKGGRRDELDRAKKMLDNDSSRTEHSDSLRTLLELGSPPPIDFKHSVTVASVARNLAELARVAPPPISDLLVQRRNTTKGSSVKKGAKVVKAIRPKSGIVALRSRGGVTKKDETDGEANSNCIKEGANRLSGVTVEDDENNINWRTEKEKRMGTIYSMDAGGSTTRTNEGEARIVEEIRKKSDNLCRTCHLHKSWIAVYLFGMVVHRVNVVCDEYANGGIPCSIDEWSTAISEYSTTRKGCVHRQSIDQLCDKCHNAIDKAAASVPATGPFCDGLRPAGGRVDIERIRSKVLALPKEVLYAAIFGADEQEPVQPSSAPQPTTTKATVSGTNVVDLTETPPPPSSCPTPDVPPVVSMNGDHDNDSISNGNSLDEATVDDGEDTVAMEENGKKKKNLKKWMEMLNVDQMLLACALSLGRDGFRDLLINRVDRAALDLLTDANWAFIVRLLAPRMPPSQRVPLSVANAMLTQHNLKSFISIEGPPAPAAMPPMRSYSSQRRVSGDSSIPVSWPIDREGVCPMCSIALKTPMGGAGTPDGDTVVVYPCSHAYHLLCMTNARHRSSPVCIVCRVRARRASRMGTVGSPSSPQARTSPR